MKALLLAVVLLAGCSPEPTPAQRATEAAYAHAKARFQYRREVERQPPTVEDRGNYWSLTLYNPPGMLGGNVWVEIRKSDFAVLGSVADQ